MREGGGSFVGRWKFEVGRSKFNSNGERPTSNVELPTSNAMNRQAHAGRSPRPLTPKLPIGNKRNGKSRAGRPPPPLPPPRGESPPPWLLACARRIITQATTNTTVTTHVYTQKHNARIRGAKLVNIAAAIKAT